MHLHKLKSFLEQFLFAAHIFVGVLLLAESRLAIPDWLYVAGRLHPVLLHFPIVILILALLILLFPQMLRNPEDQGYYGRFLLLLGCVLSALTVIAGLFLSWENGEQTAALLNHKWTGLALFWLASLIYWCSELLVKRPILFQTLTSLCLVLIVVTGHFGASLTHGDNFITAPLLKNEVELVSLEEAEVFTHMVQPILENKCISCHKGSKRKGELRLDLEEHILKGGESGPAVVPGDVEKSLLAYHILLPIEDENHMPPEGKPQLTEDEKDILIYWIESGGEFGKKVLAYGQEAPIFQLASQKFNNIPKAYTFKPADPDKIKSLNSFYRSINSLGGGSPALAVSYFSRQNFNAKSLEELYAISEQVVALNLNQMPVVDADLAVLSRLVHLERLYLNYTDIQGEGLSQLAPLQNLSVLSLSGNRLDEVSVSSLAEMKALKKLYLWDTGLDQKQIALLNEKLAHTEIETGFVDDGTVYQLNPPKLLFDKAFFEDRTEIEISHPIRNTSIYYTLDGSTPDSVHAILYREPIVIDSNSILKAKVFAEGWIGSPETRAEFVKSSVRPDTYFLRFPPSDRYKGDLVNSLFDGQKGKADVWDLAWLGFNRTHLEVEMEFMEPQDIDSLQLSIWYNAGSWLFPPGEVQIWTAGEDGDWGLAHQSRPAVPNKDQPPGLTLLPVPFKTSGIQKMKLIAKPALLPSWHGASGQQAWLMIDEVVMN